MKRDRGNREWINDYMSLKQVNPNNPFTVPEGYFDSLNEIILSKATLEELKKNPTGFTVPENYFDELSDNIQARINLEEALDKETTGFTVPENYFDELAGNIQSRINLEESLDKESTGFEVPEGYFDSLQQQIQSRIFVEEALNAQPEGFSVPENYFDNLTANILDKTTLEQKIQPRGVVRKLFATAAFKYATAACLVIAVGGTIFLSQNATNPQEAHNNSFLHKSLSVIPVDDIQNYLQSHLDVSDTHTLMDESKQVDAENLSNDLQNALDSTSQ
ncbi:MAG TPA: hypothetical protein VFE54_08265 [Mucilaginibacter sp.]|jgi:hypothetical protein|nr:hypothetical protein [Mucilaginibacter sp.]